MDLRDFFTKTGSGLFEVYEHYKKEQRERLIKEEYFNRVVGSGCLLGLRKPVVRDGVEMEEINFFTLPNDLRMHYLRKDEFIVVEGLTGDVQGQKFDIALGADENGYKIDENGDLTINIAGHGGKFLACEVDKLNGEYSLAFGVSPKISDIIAYTEDKNVMNERIARYRNRIVEESEQQL